MTIEGKWSVDHSAARRYMSFHVSTTASAGHIPLRLTGIPRLKDFPPAVKPGQIGLRRTVGHCGLGGSGPDQVYQLLPDG